MIAKEKIIQTILKNCDEPTNQLPYFLNIIRNNFAGYIRCNKSMFKMNQLNWLKEYLYHQDIKAAKQRIYNCGRLLDMRKNDRNHQMQFDMRGDIKTMLLSDSQELLDKFQNWEYDDYTNPNSEGYRIVSMSTFVQKLLRGNLKNTQEEFDLYLKYEHQYKSGKKYFFVLEKDPLIMQGLMEGDKDSIVKGLSWLISDRVFKIRNDFFDLFYGAATAYLKLAWILGYEIEIDSCLIPMDLMPIKPLKKYEVPYFFMDGYEGEIPSGWLEWKTNEELNLFEAELGYQLGRMKWDATKYTSEREAIIVECAKKNDYRIGKDTEGHIHIFNKSNKKLGMWRQGTILRLET